MPDTESDAVLEHRTIWQRRANAVAAERERRRAEQEAAEEARRARSDATAAQREVAARLAEQRRAQMQRSRELKAATDALAERLGNTRAALREAVERLDLPEAERLAERVLVIERVETELARVANEFAKTSRGAAHYVVSAGRH